MAAALPTYPHDIQGLHSLDHGLFPHVQYLDLDVNTNIAAGSAINDGHLEHAEEVATALRAISSEVFLWRIDTLADLWL